MLVRYDAQFTPEEYENHKGWGHSTWLEATRVAHEARVKTLILFHHHPAEVISLLQPASHAGEMNAPLAQLAKYALAYGLEVIPALRFGLRVNVGLMIFEVEVPHAAA